MTRPPTATRVSASRLCAAAVAAATVILTLHGQSPDAPRGVRDPSWSPDGRRLAFSYLDRIWTSNPEGRSGRPLRAQPDGSMAVERDPAWSPDGRLIAFAVDSGGGYDLFITAASGGEVRRLTALSGDERWPSFTGDGRIVFTHCSADRSRLSVVPVSGGDPAALFADTAADDELQASVSPDGTRIAYISDRDAEPGEVDLWIADLELDPRDRVNRTRLVRARGLEQFPSWAPDGARVTFYAIREGAGGIWVASADRVEGGPTRPRPSDPPVLVSRRAGVPAWSPDGLRILIANLPPLDPSYNGNPLRNRDDPPPLFAAGDAFRLWMVDAPLPVDSGARELTPSSPPRAQLVGAFDRVWETLRRLYYSSEPVASQWQALRLKFRSKAEAARTEADLERAIDAMVAEQPLIKPVTVSNRAVVVSGHPLASRAGAAILERGGNIVDAAIAVSFALGVVEPEASGIGGDGMAMLHLTGMLEPIAIDYKDQVPLRATRDNPVLAASSGHGAAAANIPGVVAGMALLHRRFGSRAVSWTDLLAPAIELADAGFVLDEALPTSVAEGRTFFERYPAAARIYLPGGRPPRAGDRFVNADYAATLKTLAAEGADAFYRGSIAKRIAADMAGHGGLIGLDDLAQYRAIERRPLSGRYRDHVVYSPPPPVSTGALLVETLQILENYTPRPGATIATDADYFHHAVEAWRVRDQAPRIADPALWDVSLGAHLEPAHAASLFRRIDPARIYREPVAAPSDAPERIGRGTTAFAVADADGNMIALTQTLSTWGGTFYVSDGLGFLYNNHLRLPPAAAAGRFLPLARSSSTSVPTLIFKSAGAGAPASPRLAVAAAGNAWIPASVYNIVLNVIDGGLDAQRAIEGPRFLVGRDPADPTGSRPQIEDRIPRAILDDLTRRGHRFQKIGRKGEVRYGYAAAVVVDTGRRQVEGGAEPRRSHAAVGVAPVATPPDRASRR